MVSLTVAKGKLVAGVLAFSTVMFICDMAAGSRSVLRIMSDMYLMVMVMFFISSTFVSWEKSRMAARLLVGVEFLFSIYYILCACRILPLPDDMVYLCTASFFAVTVLSIYIFTLGLRIYDIKKLMKTSNVWSSVCHSLETIHLMLLTISFVIYLCVCAVTGSLFGWHLNMMVVMLLLEIVMQVIRASSESVFVFMRRHERLIMESMKISSVESHSKESQKTEYQEIYDRLVAYFETQKAYLKSDLTINEVAAAVFSNRLYIARAISQYTGRNFCQFVNYYRVMYAVQIFREQPDMRVNELANTCGFNSMVSFAAAFRLFMNETPSDWCRMEKARLLKKKK